MPFRYRVDVFPDRPDVRVVHTRSRVPVYDETLDLSRYSDDDRDMITAFRSIDGINYFTLGDGGPHCSRFARSPVYSWSEILPQIIAVFAKRYAADGLAKEV